MSPRLLRSSIVLALVAAACGVEASSPSEDVAAGTPTATSPSTAQPGDTVADSGAVLPAGPSALDDMFSADFPTPLVDPAEILSGGPPPDGIPPIDSPAFVPIVNADEYLADDESVVVLEIEGDARAYPVQIMIWHEIVNDEVGGVPVAITYCPLCNSAVSYMREVRGVTTTFGTSGRLFASALVMYDRLTESLWTHFDGRAVVGVLTGDELEPIASPLLAWGEFKEAYPQGMVLDREATGFPRDYGRNPYAGYDDPETTPFLFRGTVDDRARAKQRVVGVDIDGQAKAWTLELVSEYETTHEEARVTRTDLAGQDLVILWVAGQASALEAGGIDEGRDVGSVGVFVPEADGQDVTLDAVGDAFVDDETGSTWNVLGNAVSGPLIGTSLERIPHLDTFWFAWSTYRPGTELVE